MYIPDKRERYGVKVVMLRESNSVYFYNFKVYSGSGTTYPEPTGVNFQKVFEDYHVYSKIVLSLADGLFGQVTLDNL